MRARKAPVAHAPVVRRASIGGQTVRYAVGGSPRASRALLLFNGLGASVESAMPFMAGFERTRVITFDVPGVGESPAPLLPYRMRDVAGLAAGLLDRLGIERADVFGVSWGGAAAQEFAIRHARRCRSLTLAATSAGIVIVPGQPGVLLELFSPTRLVDPVRLVTMGAALAGGPLRLLLDALALHARSSLGPPLHGFFYQLLALWGWTSWHRLHLVHAPTLVLVGRDDPIVPPINGRIVAWGLRDATVESVDCGHLFVLTRPGETAARVERFIGLC
jgi:poly(3-hydroxyalkanoate) depolymerase